MSLFICVRLWGKSIRFSLIPDDHNDHIYGQNDHKKIQHTDQLLDIFLYSVGMAVNYL
jgi:hypothetical protein